MVEILLPSTHHHQNLFPSRCSQKLQLRKSCPRGSKNTVVHGHGGECRLGKVSHHHSNCKSHSQCMFSIFYAKSWDLQHTDAPHPLPASSSSRVLLSLGKNVRALCLPYDNSNLSAMSPHCHTLLQSSPQTALAQAEGKAYSFFQSIRKDVAGDGKM